MSCSPYPGRVDQDTHRPTGPVGAPMCPHSEPGSILLPLKTPCLKASSKQHVEFPYFETLHFNQANPSPSLSLTQSQNLGCTSTLFGAAISHTWQLQPGSRLPGVADRRVRPSPQKTHPVAPTFDSPRHSKFGSTVSDTEIVWNSSTRTQPPPHRISREPFSQPRL